jgi:hypothetical protein
MQTKLCKSCGIEKPVSDFQPYKANGGRIYLKGHCRSCLAVLRRDYNHRTGRNNAMDQDKNCPLYLGYCIAERVLSHYFEDVIRMPPNNPGYDFICKKGFKIDAKSSCTHKMDSTDATTWEFGINRNKVADYFLCLGFDDKEHLTPLKVWLIPGSIINTKRHFNIPTSASGLSKWSQYEKPLDKILICCDALREH